MCKKQLLAAAVGILSLLLSACSTKYIPVQTQEIAVTDGFAILKNSDLTFVIENKYWIKEPQNLTDYFTTFYISVKNISGDKMKISLDDIVLLDAEGNQYDAVSIDYIEQMLLPKQLEYLIINTIEEENSLMTNTEEVLREKQNRLEKWREAKQNLLSDSYHFGNIMPNAQKSGFIFFSKLDVKNNTCKVVFRENEIEFIRSDMKKKQEK